MTQARTVKRLMKGRPTLEGAGVHLSRIFGFLDTAEVDPFLLLDHFGSTNPSDYTAGFPWHPHRGIDTITYVLKGKVAHGDSLGNAGVISAGDVQWMSAASGIVHQEMPKGDETFAMEGFQLWANLPASHKMTDPKYQEIASKEIPTVEVAPGVMVRVIAGSVNGVTGPVLEVIIQPEYLDITFAPNARYTHLLSLEHTAFAYVFEGSVAMGDTASADTQLIERGTLALFSQGDCVDCTAGPEGGRLILVSGRPLKEPIAWAGPIVMNTQEELDLAFKEYRIGQFIKKNRPT